MPVKDSLNIEISISKFGPGAREKWQALATRFREAVVNLGLTEATAAAEMQRCHVQGWQGDDKECPLANYFKRWMPMGVTVTVDYAAEDDAPDTEVTGSILIYGDDGSISADLPEHLARFACQFDGGKYSELIRAGDCSDPPV